MKTLIINKPAAKVNRKKDAGKINPEFEKLSERETEILQQMANGLSSKGIGEILCISEDTVETHRKNIYRKIAAKNAAGAMAYGFRNKLII